MDLSAKPLLEQTPMTTATPADLSPEPKPGLFRRTLGRHWVGLLAFWLVTSAVVLASIFVLVHPSYKSSSIVKIEPQPTSLYGIKTNDETFDFFLRTQMQLITSPNVLSAAGFNPKVSKLARIKNATDVVQELNKVVDATIIPQTTLVEVSMTSTDSQEAAVIVNAVMDAYLATNEEWANSLTKNLIMSLENYLRDLNAQTDELERQWIAIVASGDADGRMLANRNAQGKTDLTNPAGISIEQSRFLKDKLFQLHLELVQAEAWAKDLKDDFNKEAASRAAKEHKIIEAQFRTDPEVLALAEEMQKADLKFKDARRMAKNGDDPAVRAAQKKLDSLKEKYNQIWETKSQEFLKKIDLVVMVGVDDQKIREAETLVRELQVKEAALQAEAKKYEVIPGPTATDQVKIKLLQDQRSSLKEMQNAVQRQLEQLRFESRGENRVRKVNEAVASARPIKDLRPILMTIASIALLLVSFCPFLIFEAVNGPEPRPAVTISEPAKTDPAPVV
jgi:hypothetical protein